MARNLSWIDPEKLASLLDVVSPAPRPEQRVAGDDPAEATIDSALFAATYTSAPTREAPAARPTPTSAAAPAARPAAPTPPVRAEVEPPASAPPRRAVAAASVETPLPAALAAAAPAAVRPSPARPAAVEPANAPQAAPVAAPANAPQAAPVAAPAVASPAPQQPALAPFQPDPRADLAARLEAFLDWVVATTRSRGALITDAHGLVVVERRASEVEACMTTSVDLMLNHVADVVQSDHDGHVALHRNGLHLVTLWTPSEHGRFFGVLIGETVPPQESIALAGQGLRTLFAN